MRTLSYLSPTSLSIYMDDKVRFYLLYLADTKLKREPQTEPMAIGSAFDAYVKSYLHERLFGKDPKFDLRTLFEAQVETQNRTKAWDAGRYVFEQYKASGILTDLMIELDASVTTPRFEFDLMGVVDNQKEAHLGGVPFLGKPDLFYTNKEAARVIHDWKVNGFYSKNGASPVQGYIKLRTVGQPYKAHKNALPMRWKGLTLNMAQTLDMVKVDWAQQLAIYMWLCGEDVGTEDCAGSIDQIVCKPGSNVLPDLHFAEHRSKISKTFQLGVFNKAREAWNCITSGHYFQDMSLEDSKKRCEMLDKLQDSGSKEAVSNDDWHKNVTRPY